MLICSCLTQLLHFSTRSVEFLLLSLKWRIWKWLSSLLSNLKQGFHFDRCMANVKKKVKRGNTDKNTLLLRRKTFWHELNDRNDENEEKHNQVNLIHLTESLTTFNGQKKKKRSLALFRNFDYLFVIDLITASTRSHEERSQGHEPIQIWLLFTCFKARLTPTNHDYPHHLTHDTITTT